MDETIKRLFFGAEVEAPWPEKLPPGRLLDEKHRHLTLEFLGNIPYEKLAKLLPEFPAPEYRVAPVGHFDELLLLPHRHPNVAAWHVSWHRNTALESLQKQLSEWLRSHGYAVDGRPWLPHVTLCRQPMNPRRWIDDFHQLPFTTGSIHLYESRGNLTYEPIWSLPVQRPFIEIEHTADMAFEVYAETMAQLYDNASIALCFKCPALLRFIDLSLVPQSHEEIVEGLNRLIAVADGAVGCPMKAVSFHGEASKLPNGLLHWEMIVDV